MTETQPNHPKKHYYRATIQYDGTGFAGFQWQKDIPAIQNEFNEAIKRIMSGKVTTMGASRTDTGVHAVKQTVKITSEDSIECSSFQLALNHQLPSQIRCLEIVPCKGNFKPASDSLSKEYRYFFTNKRNVPSGDLRFISNFPIQLNLDPMINCARYLHGIHDFRNFCSAGSNVKSTVREMTFCELSEINPHIVFNNSDIFHIPKGLVNCYQFRIEGNGFLKHMIRHIVSALWMVGSGKLTTEDFLYLLNGPIKEKRMWKTASPNGLFLFDLKLP